MANELELLDNETIWKQYVFVGSKDRDDTHEDSLTVTNKRIIRRLVSEEDFYQREMFIRDVSQIEVTSTPSSTKKSNLTKNAKTGLVFLFIILFSLIAFIIVASIQGLGGGIFIAGGFLLLDILFIILCFGSREKEKKKIMRIAIMSRSSNECAIAIHKSFPSNEAAREIADKIGSFVFRVRAAEKSRNK